MQDDKNQVDRQHDKGNAGAEDDALQAMIASLLRRAGITQPVSSIQAVRDQGITNHIYRLQLDDGDRFIVRRYRWPWAERDHDRLSKEQYLHRALQQAGVPVPAILADLELAGESAVLMEYVAGEILGDVTAGLSDTARADAWRSTGEMLRRAHTITYPEGSYGVIVGEQVHPFGAVFRELETDPRKQPPTWGSCQAEMIWRHFQRLVKRAPELAPVGQELRETLAAAIPYLNRTPPTLLHNDAHPWNVLVRADEERWRCVAWLDWEYAWVGDPKWDLVRMDLFRRKPIGLTPDAFWEGYGRAPAEPERAVYTLHISVWMANQYLDGDRRLAPTYDAALAYVSRLDAAVKDIQRLL